MRDLDKFCDGDTVFENLYFLRKRVTSPFGYQNRPDVPVYNSKYESASVRHSSIIYKSDQNLHSHAHQCIGSVPYIASRLLWREERRSDQSNAHCYHDHHSTVPRPERSLKVRPLEAQPKKTDGQSKGKELPWVAFKLQNERVSILRRRQYNHDERRDIVDHQTTDG